jgi:tetraacyldisaccharide 4'-kinase
MWSGEAGALARLVRTALLPAEGLFRAGGALRRSGYDRGLLRARPGAISVVSVGNLSVGGTGKTPVASWMVRQLLAEGERPALVARGYGRDEMLLHRGWTPSVPVIADPDRRAGVAEAARQGATVAVLDDGFQHRRLGREVDLVLLALEEGRPGPLLPRGPFREPLSALERAHGLVVTRKSGTEEAARGFAGELGQRFPDAVVRTVHLAPGGLRPLHGDPDGSGVMDLGPVTVATAVARPESVRASVCAAGHEVRRLEAFPDHHEFTAGDLERLLARSRGESIVVTEKDAVKLIELPGTRGAPIWVMGQVLVWGEDPGPLVDAVVRRVRARR